MSAALLALLVLAAAPKGSDPRAPVREFESHGFRLAPPDAGWTVTETRDPLEGKLQVVLRPAGTNGTVEASVAASPAPAGATPVSLLATARAGIEGKAAYAEIVEVEATVAGATTPGLSVRFVQEGGATYRILQLYVVRADVLYVLTFHATVAAFAGYEAAFDAIRESLELFDPPTATRREWRLRTLARRCGSEVEWAPDWDSAARTAAREGKHVLVVVRAYRGFELPDEIRSTTFMDPGVIAIAREHLVCLRLEDGMPAPFRAPEVYGMSATTFGQALLLVDPDGRVIDETCWLRPAPAREFLRRALGMPEGAARPDTAVARAVALLRAGKTAEAAALLDDAQVAADPEAAWWAGVCAARAGDRERARTLWEGLCDEHPDSRWAWQAAAMLLGTVWRLGLTPDPRDPAPEVLASLHRGRPDPSVTAAEAEAGALAWLLGHQRDDGSWISPSEVNGAGRDHPHAFVDAAAALAGRAVLRCGDDPRCAAAAARAAAFLLASHERARLDTDPVRLMDYRVWSRALTLRFLADCLDAGIGEPARLRGVMAALVGELLDTQAAGGGWSYFLSTSPDDVVARPARSTSFVTATVVLALLRARETGIDVPAGPWGRAVDCLEGMRGTDGAFSYMRSDDAPAMAGPVGVAGAAGRGALCELALLRAGRSDDVRVRAALGAFRDHRTLFHAEQGKTLMHAGPDGQGCHYLLFDYACAAEAVAALPASEREAHRAWITDLVLSARARDGAFQDTLILGWSCGTALALLGLSDLRAVE